MQAAPGTRLWVARYNGPANGDDYAGAMAVSPDGRRVFVTGGSYDGRLTGTDYKTVAYSTATGRRLWASRYSGPRLRRPDGADSVAVSPDGSTVFVTGSSAGRGTGSDYATVAYSAATGKQLWASRYNGGPYDQAFAVTASPDANTVFVTGTIDLLNGFYYATIAYSAATGKQLWISRYHGPADGQETSPMAVSPDGNTVFVIASGSNGQTHGGDYATIAYSAATGRQLWVSRYNGPARRIDDATSVAVSPDGATVFVTGVSDSRTTNPLLAGDYATVAYSAATGRELWASRYNGPANGGGVATAVAVSPGGARVFVTGVSKNPGTGYDYATVAYSAASGRQLWASRYHGYEASSVAVSPDGATLYVTGAGGGLPAYYATVAYRAATGKQLWASWYGTANYGHACCVAVSPAGTKLFVTGYSEHRTTGDDYATIAYRG